MQLLQYQFHTPALLQVALTHRSVRGKNNERLEFLGDAVLNFIIAAALFRQFPHAKEGQLSRLRANLVNENELADIAQEFQLGNYLHLGPGELKSGGARRKSILADAVEAIIGAIYLDANMQTCEECILKWYAERLAHCESIENLKDAKSRLQEYLQARKISLPSYIVLEVTGEAHAQHFKVSCDVPALHYRTEGEGSTRRAAEQSAAEAFLDWLGYEKH